MKTPAPAILELDGQKLPLSIPQNSVVRVVDGPLDCHKLVDVEWEGKRVMMFALDLRERGELVDAG